MVSTLQEGRQFSETSCISRPHLSFKWELVTLIFAVFAKMDAIEGEVRVVR